MNGIGVLHLNSVPRKFLNVQPLNSLKETGNLISIYIDAKVIDSTLSFNLFFHSILLLSCFAFKYIVFRFTFSIFGKNIERAGVNTYYRYNKVQKSLPYI